MASQTNAGLRIPRPQPDIKQTQRGAQCSCSAVHWESVSLVPGAKCTTKALLVSVCCSCLWWSVGLLGGYMEHCAIPVRTVQAGRWSTMYKEGSSVARCACIWWSGKANSVGWTTHSNQVHIITPTSRLCMRPHHIWTTPPSCHHNSIAKTLTMHGIWSPPKKLV